MKLIIAPDPILLTICESVTDIEEQVLPFIPEMRRILREKKGAGLAANQVGIARRFFIDKQHVYINPELEPIDVELLEGREGCLSLPGGMYLMERWRGVRLTYWDLECKEHVVEARIPNQTKSLKDIAQLTKCLMFQHEMDHLNGQLVKNLGKELKGQIGPVIDEKDRVFDPRQLPVVGLAELQKHVNMTRTKKLREQDQ